ncbi:MAG TPA: pitrilysin family protein [Tepidisphaeraceae bacterium]|nr:pitrilysin family protein [Tepidisphaeraceae bacterium]
MKYLVVALLAVASAAAQQLNLDIPYKKFILPNGLTLIVHEDHKAPVVAVNVWYHVGSKNEKPGKTGFAHLFEHLMFGGSENVKTTYLTALEKVGATDLNGTTSNDRTNFFETVPTTALDYTLFLESDRMGHLLGSFDEKTLTTQRGVVQNEKRQGENEPYGVVEQLMTDGTYPAAHPYSWTVIGSMSDLNAASLDDVKEWFRTYYAPSNATLVIAGDIDPETAKAKVEKYFGDIPPGPPVAHQGTWIAKMSGIHKERAEDRVPQARVYKVWNVVESGSPDEPILDLIAACLSQGKDSRLYKRLVYDDQIATTVQAFSGNNEIGGQFVITVTLKSEADLAKAEAAVDEELARLIKDGPTADELERARTNYIATFVRGLDRVGGFGGKSDVLAEGQVFHGNPTAYKDRLRYAQEATPAKLQAVAKQWLTDGQFELEIVPFPALKSEPKGVDRSKLPEVTSAPDSKLPKLHRGTLSNGLKVVVAERHDIPVVDATMLFDAGYAADQNINAGTSSLTMTVMRDGTKSRDALQISNDMLRLGAQLTTASTLDASNVTLSAIKPRLDDSLALFADVILNPSFPAADFEREKKLQLARIEQEKSQPMSMALRVLPALEYGKGHAYGNPLTGSGTPASVAKITRDDLTKFHATWMKPNDATLIIAGDTTLAEIQPKLEKLFGAWKPGDVPKKNLTTVAHPAKSAVYLIDRPGALQSYIISGEVGTPKNSPGEIATDVMNDMIGGTFGSRLNMNLREDKHWSYGAFSFFRDAKGQRPFVTLAPVQTDKTKESLAEVDRELHQFASAQPVTQGELAAAVDNRTLSLPGSRESLRAVLGTVQEMVEFGYPDDYFDTYASKVKALRVADINDAAKSILHPDNLIWIIVGDRAKIEKGVQELNMGEVHLIDPDGNPVR